MIARTITVNQQTCYGQTTTPKGRTRRTIPMTSTARAAAGGDRGEPRRSGSGPPGPQDARCPWPKYGKNRGGQRRELYDSRRLTGGDKGDRTPDLVNAIHALSQLSYIPVARSRFLLGDPPAVKGRLGAPARDQVESHERRRTAGVARLASHGWRRNGWRRNGWRRNGWPAWLVSSGGSTVVVGGRLWRDIVGMHVVGEVLVVVELDAAFAVGIAGEGAGRARGLWVERVVRGTRGAGGGGGIVVGEGGAPDARGGGGVRRGPAAGGAAGVAGAGAAGGRDGAVIGVRGASGGASGGARARGVFVEIGSASGGVRASGGVFVGAIVEAAADGRLGDPVVGVVGV